MARSWRTVARRLAVAIGGIAVLACGGAPWPAGAGSANAEACRAYRDVYNALPCTNPDLPASFCPEVLDVLGCDATQYYACLREGVRCNKDLLDASGQLACVSSCP